MHVLSKYNTLNAKSSLQLQYCAKLQTPKDTQNDLFIQVDVFVIQIHI